MISPLFLDAPKLLLKFKRRKGLWDNDPGLKEFRLPNVLQPIPVTNRTYPANYLTHIMLLNCWLCSLTEVN